MDALSRLGGFLLRVWIAASYVVFFATAIRFVIWIWSQPLKGWWTLVL